MVKKEALERAAKTARLELSSKEIREFSGDLASILEAFRVLQKAKTDGVEPSFQPLPMGNVLREDQVEKGLSQAEALANATSLCFTMGMLFRDRFVYFVLGSAGRYEAELQGQLRLMKNLLDPERYREILSRYK